MRTTFDGRNQKLERPSPSERYIYPCSVWVDFNGPHNRSTLSACSFVLLINTKGKHFYIISICLQYFLSASISRLLYIHYYLCTANYPLDLHDATRCCHLQICDTVLSPYESASTLMWDDRCSDASRELGASEEGKMTRGSLVKKGAGGGEDSGGWR